MEPFIGLVALMAFNFAPKGWLECRGQILPVGNYVALFALLGARFGGDGDKTFALPNLSAPDGMMYCIAIEGVFPTRD